ncbi:Protein of unknown function [Bacillus cereus]|nr:Protein of unknown function [Bacillus cereus]
MEGGFASYSRREKAEEEG